MFTVLIIDDEPQICLMMRRLFERVGWNARCVSDSRTAAGAVRQTKADAVLLDLMMPEVDGLGVLAQIRSNPETAKVPVVLYSALNDDMTKARAKAAGADDFIVKTTPIQKIVECLSRYAA